MLVKLLFFHVQQSKKSIKFCKGLIISTLLNFRTPFFEKNACWIFDRVQIALAHKSHMAHWLHNLSMSLCAQWHGCLAETTPNCSAHSCWGHQAVSSRTKVRPLSWDKIKELGSWATGTGKSKALQTHPVAPSSSLGSAEELTGNLPAEPQPAVSHSPSGTREQRAISRELDSHQVGAAWLLHHSQL